MLKLMFSEKATKFEKRNDLEMMLKVWFLIHKCFEFYQMGICLDVSLMQIRIRDVSTGATGTTAVAPNFSDTLNKRELKSLVLSA